MTALGAAIEATKTPEEKAAEQAQRANESLVKANEERQRAIAEQSTLNTYTASEIAHAYEENTVAADGLFKGKKFKVSGSVASINTDIFGNPYLTLRGGVNQFMEPQFSFDESSSKLLATVKKGEKVNLICIGKGDIAKTPMSGDCIML